MSLSAKREALARIRGRYQRAGRLHKKIILDEFCATCGYHRKAAVRLLNRRLRTQPSKRSGPKIVYDPAEVLPVLKAIWLASEQLCSQLLKAALPGRGARRTFLIRTSMRTAQFPIRSRTHAPCASCCASITGSLTWPISSHDSDAKN
jgi:hypothetical protein